MLPTKTQFSTREPPHAPVSVSAPPLPSTALRLLRSGQQFPAKRLFLTVTGVSITRAAEPFEDMPQ